MRSKLIFLLRLTTAVLFLLFAVVCVLNFMMTGSFLPWSIVEKLDNPVAVREITKDGLVAADGSVIKLPFVTKVPTDLPALQDAVRRGVEMDSQGRVYGLLKIWHWCGNDPVRRHVGRVDLSALVLLGDQLAATHATTESLADKWDFVYADHGLNISYYARIQSLSSELSAKRGAPAGHGPP